MDLWTYSSRSTPLKGPERRDPLVDSSGTSGDDRESLRVAPKTVCGFALGSCVLIIMRFFTACSINTVVNGKTRSELRL